MKHLTLVIVLISSFSLAATALAGNRIFVGNLPFATTSAEVNRLVSGFGTVLSVKVKSIWKVLLRDRLCALLNCRIGGEIQLSLL